MSIKIVHV